MSGNGKVFISHAHEDNDRCASIIKALKSWGIDYWFDMERMDAGKGITPTIQREIGERDIFIRICTPAAQRSYWVPIETDAFRGLQAEDYKHGQRDKRLLINVILDPSYVREPFDHAFMFIDATNKPQAVWLDELHRALIPQSASDESENIKPESPTYIVDPATKPTSVAPEMQAKPARRGNAFVFGLTLLGVVLFAGAGLYYLIPGFYHPFTSDTPHQTYAHLTAAFVLFVGAVLCLIAARFTKPANSEASR